MRIEDRTGDVLPEATVTVDSAELIDLLQGLADVVEEKKTHLHLGRPGGSQLVVRTEKEADADPLGRQLDWYVGPLILFAVLFVVIGVATVIRWAVGLLA